MNIEEYISSGILEQYVLNGLSEQERSEVQANAAQYPAIQAEIDAIEYALFQYVQANAIPLNEGQAQAILDQIDATQKSITNNSNANSSKGGNNNILSILLAIALIGLAGFTFYLSQQNSTLQADLAQNQVAATAQQQVCDSLRILVPILESKLNILTNPNYSTTFIQQENSQNYAAIHRNSTDQVAYLDVSQLPPPPTGKQYQLWYISTADPQSMGVFELSDEFITVAFIEDAAVFAISLEDEGGSPVPTDIRYLGTV